MKNDAFFEARTGTNRETSPMGKKPLENPNRYFCKHLVVYKIMQIMKEQAGYPGFARGPGFLGWGCLQGKFLEFRGFSEWRVPCFS